MLDIVPGKHDCGCRIHQGEPHRNCCLGLVTGIGQWVPVQMEVVLLETRGWVKSTNNASIGIKSQHKRWQVGKAAGRGVDSWRSITVVSQFSRWSVLRAIQVRLHDKHMVPGRCLQKITQRQRVVF